MVVFFDIDDTLIDSELAHLKTIKKIYQQYLIINEDNESVENGWLSITENYLKLYFEGRITLDQQRILRIMEFWKSKGQQIDEDQAGKIYHHYHQLFLQTCISFNDAIPVLAKLKACRYKLGIISNGAYSDQLFKLKNNKLIQYFDQIVISEKAGFSKPDKEIFHLAARQAGEIPSNCIHIGDSYELDYLGSINSGMKAIWLDRKNSDTKCNCKTIHLLNELEGILFLK